MAVLVPLTIFAKTDKQPYVACPDEDAQHDLIGQSYPIFVSYIAVSYVLVIAGFILEVGICRATGRGTPTQPEKRTTVQRLCHWKLIPLSIVRVAAIILGLLSLAILKTYCNCKPDPDTAHLLEEECDNLRAYRTYFRILVGTHIFDGASVGIIVLYFTLKCAPNTPPLVSAETKWRMFCHCCMSALSCATCCCCLAGGCQVGDYSDIAMVLADYFDDGGTLDIVASDIVVALLVLLRVQDERREECIMDVLEKAKGYQEEPDTSVKEGKHYSSVEEGEEFNLESFVDAREEEKSTDSDESSIDSALARLALAELNLTSRHPLAETLVLQVGRTESSGRVYFRPTARAVLMANNPLDRLAIAEGARFMRYARAMYTWKMDLIEKPISSCTVFGTQLIRSICSKRNVNVVGDNRFGFNDASLESFANLEPEQVAYASFVEGMEKSPFCVVLDHEWKSVVISIRGTLSIEDAVTDITLRPESMEECGTRCGFDGRLCYAHAGMLTTSEWIYDQLERYYCLWTDACAFVRSSCSSNGD